MAAAAEQIKSTSQESWGGKVDVCVCVHAQILMHGQKQASLISTLSEGQGVQELDSKSMTQSKMSAHTRSTPPGTVCKMRSGAKNLVRHTSQEP